MINDHAMPEGLTESPHFALRLLDAGVYAAIARDGGAAISNAALIDLGGHRLVFDTFLTPQAAQDLRQVAIDLFGEPPDMVVNSHYHNDHIWGNQVFAPDAHIISTTRTRHLMTTAGVEEFQWYSAHSSERLAALRSQINSSDDEAQRRQLALWIGYYAGLVDALPALSPHLPEITFENRLEIHGIDLEAELIAFEGAHTGSDTVLYLPSKGIVFMSDLLFVGAHPYLPDGDPDRLLQALRQLSQLEAACFVPGHGPVGTRADLEALIAYIEACLHTAQVLVESGETRDDRLEHLEIPAGYRQWQLSHFYPANIRFLCERLSKAHPVHRAA